MKKRMNFIFGLALTLSLLSLIYINTTEVDIRSVAMIPKVDQSQEESEFSGQTYLLEVVVEFFTQRVPSDK